MDFSVHIDPEPSLRMANEDFYRSQADSYKKSAEYSRMIGLYPTLKFAIGECKDERFIT